MSLWAVQKATRGCKAGVPVRPFVALVLLADMRMMLPTQLHAVLHLIPAPALGLTDPRAAAARPQALRQRVMTLSGRLPWDHCPLVEPEAGSLRCASRCRALHSGQRDFRHRQ